MVVGDDGDAVGSVDEIYSFIVLVSRCDGFRRRGGVAVHEQRGLAVGAEIRTVESGEFLYGWVSKWIDDWFVSRAVVDVEVWNSWSFLRVWCDWRRVGGRLERARDELPSSERKGRRGGVEIYRRRRGDC